MSPLQVSCPLVLPGACSLTLSYSSLARLSISRMSMGLCSLQPLAWLGLCLSRAACWERRVSSSTTLEDEKQVLATPVKTQSDPRTLLVFIFQEYRKNVMITMSSQYKTQRLGYLTLEYMTNQFIILYMVQHCQPIYFTVRRTKIQNSTPELLEIGTLKCYAEDLRSCSLAYTVRLVQINSYTYSPQVWIFLTSTQINRRKSDLMHIQGEFT